MSNVRDIIFNTAINGGMINHGDSIVVGVSGGADSMCLLHFLVSIQKEYALNITVAHINHNLRGEEALRDQHFVEAECEKSGVECRVLSADINEISAKTGEGSEECGRRIRYEFFSQLSSENGKIATAHTLSDNAETILFNMVRGSGLKGLVGIPKVRGNIIRPVIDITRQQVEAYCTENNISYITDSSNLTDDYSRNKIRNNVVPVLKDINPTFEQAFSRLSQIVSEQLGTVNSAANKLLHSSKVKNGYSCEKLLCEDIAVVKQAVINILQSVGCTNYQEKHISLICNIIRDKHGAVQLSNEFTAVSNQGVFRVYKNSQNNKTENEILLFKEKNEFVINNQKITVEIITKQGFDEIVKIHNLLVKNAVDYDIIPCDTQIRTRMPKDTFKPYGRGITKTLKKLFIEARIPAEKRSLLPVIASENRVLWVSGFGAAQDCAVTEKTKNVAIIRVVE
ncbi:MAG: tRNA lysidine(34) synthetase TilS [Acutalibacteraceae bacterium]|nr:tRNA lysidine(34) synthetase TilS [Acutalibacteraceae bacterium]